MTDRATDVLLVGSVPLPTVSDVFEIMSKQLHGRLKRIPDGEVGERGNFVVWQFAHFANVPQLLTFGPPVAVDLTDDEAAKLVAGLPSPLETGYDTHAISSYKIFAQMQDEGVIAPDVRFQVCLPTPLNILAVVKPRFQPLLEPVIYAAIVNAIRNIQSAIPATKLSIQLDAAFEFAFLEDIKAPYGMEASPWFSPVFEGIVERVLQIAKEISSDVALGFHLCYGDRDHVHFVEPKDVGTLVKFANSLLKGSQRRIDWVHMPVPKDRDDAAYLAPLRELEKPDHTQLYLGLVHAHDEEGTWRRVATAKIYLDKFGVATECGMGRSPAEDLASILDISSRVSAGYK